jgi:hypothetical protein
MGITCHSRAGGNSAKNYELQNLGTKIFHEKEQSKGQL